MTGSKFHSEDWQIPGFVHNFCNFIWLLFLVCTVLAIGPFILNVLYLYVNLLIVAVGSELLDWGDLPAGIGIFLFMFTFKMSPEPTWPHMQWLLGVPFWGVKLSDHEANLSFKWNVLLGWRYVSTGKMIVKSHLSSYIDFIVLHVLAHIEASSGKKVLKESCLAKYLFYNICVCTEISTSLAVVVYRGQPNSKGYMKLIDTY